jgi:hypothetical protein
MKQLFAALVKCQAKLGAAAKDKTNPHFKSKYADLASVVDAIKPVAAECGLAYVQIFREAEGGVCIETVIVHESGEEKSTGPLFVPASKQDAQGYGSAITYARRYGRRRRPCCRSLRAEAQPVVRARVGPSGNRG